MCYTTEPTYDDRTNGKTRLFSLSFVQYREVEGSAWYSSPPPPLRVLRNISVLFRLKNMNGLVENKDIILSCEEQLYMLVSVEIAA